MTCIDYRTLSEALVRGGIAPRRVDRLVWELRDHHSDLEEYATSEGMGRADAAAYADTQLGYEQNIVSELLARKELKSWAARWPWVFYTLLPPAAMSAMAAGAVLLLIVLAKTGGVLGDGVVVPGWLISMSAVVRAIVMYTVPIVLGAAIAWTAVGRRTGWLWPVLGMVLVAFLGSTYAIGIEWGATLDASEISAAVGWIWPYPLRLEAAVRFPANLLLVLVPYVYLFRTMRLSTGGSCGHV